MEHRENKRTKQRKESETITLDDQFLVQAITKKIKVPRENNHI